MHAGTRTLAVDIGGTWIKAMVLDARGRPASPESRTPTPQPATFHAVMKSMRALGTGVGSALFLDGRLVPNLELGHHPFERGRTYEERLSDRVLHRMGVRRWKERLMRAVATLQRAFNPRRTYLGGGNARFLKRGLPPGVIAVDNVAGVLGGIHLWDETPRRRGKRLIRPAVPLRARSRPAGSVAARATSRS